MGQRAVKRDSKKSGVLFVYLVATISEQFVGDFKPNLPQLYQEKEKSTNINSYILWLMGNKEKKR